MSNFEYIFPAIRGIQAGCAYYVSVCPLRLIPRIFLFDEDELRPELRAQRILNKNRIPEIARYIVQHPSDYTFSALTASIDGEINFEPLGPGGPGHNVGQIRIPMSARFVINDGQHRRAGIEAALRENPELGDETIAVVFFMDLGLKRCQQMFADLNRYAIRPSSSLSIAYDHRDEYAQIAKTLLQRVSVFTDLTETERSTISNRSIKLFTLSGIYQATRTLLAAQSDETIDVKTALAAEFWNEVAKQVTDWQLAKERKISAADLRRDYVHAHTLALCAIARVGTALLGEHSKDWKRRLARLKSLDWSRSNEELWEGRAMTTGRLSKRLINVGLTGNAIKQHIGLRLSPAEQELEDQFQRNRNAQVA
jgi:DNA sulfur modification protein DndB